MADPMPSSALAVAGGRAQVNAEGLKIEEGAPVGAVVLRTRGDEAIGRAGAAVGLDLAIATGRVAERSGLAALRLAPDEWLLLLAREEESALRAELAKALAGSAGAAVAGGNGLVELVVSGPRSRAFLAKAIALDLHKTSFGPGRCAATGMGKVRAVLRQWDQSPRFSLWIARSFAMSVWEWAIDAAREWA